MTHSISANGAPRLHRQRTTNQKPEQYTWTWTRFECASRNSQRPPTHLHQQLAAIPPFSSSNSSYCHGPPAAHSARKRHSQPTSSNSFAGWMPAGHDVEHQSTPYTVQQWELLHLILAPPRSATAPCATLTNPCEPTTSLSYRCSTNATWASSRIGAITYARVTPHAAR